MRGRVAADFGTAVVPEFILPDQHGGHRRLIPLTARPAVAKGHI
jgi:hypothetical protein